MTGRKGFTLTELLIVILVIGLLFSITFPLSYSAYEKYKALSEATELLKLISKLRTESFLYSEEKVIFCKEGKLFVNDTPLFFREDTFLDSEAPIKFYKTGTTQGGTIKISIRGYAFQIEISAPDGGLILKKL